MSRSLTVTCLVKLWLKNAGDAHTCSLSPAVSGHLQASGQVGGGVLLRRMEGGELQFGGKTPHPLRRTGSCTDLTRSALLCFVLSCGLTSSASTRSVLFV